jgi:hypothetical protein
MNQRRQITKSPFTDPSFRNQNMQASSGVAILKSEPSRFEAGYEINAREIGWRR